MRTLWNDCEPSKGFVRSGRSVRQYDLLLRCSSARLVWGFRVSAFAFFYSGGALLDSRVRNHASVQGRSAVWNLSFQEEVLALPCCSEKICHILFYLTAFCIIRAFPPHLHPLFSSFPIWPICPFCLPFCIPPRFSRFSSLASPGLPFRNSAIFATKITQSKVKPLASESGNFFPRQNCGFSKIALDKLPVT